jgi:hypothetical protein
VIPITTESQEDLFLAGITSQAEKSVSQDATLQIVVKLMLHIRGQACGSGVSVERGEKGLQMV